MQSLDNSFSDEKKTAKSRNTSFKLVSHCSVDLPTDQPPIQGGTSRVEYYNLGAKKRQTSDHKIRGLRKLNAKSNKKPKIRIHGTTDTQKIFQGLKVHTVTSGKAKGSKIMRLKSPRLNNINTTFTKMSSTQNMMCAKHVTDDLIAPEEEEDISTRRDTDNMDTEGDVKKNCLKEFNDIKVSYLNLSGDDHKKKKKISRHSHGITNINKKYTPKGSQGKFVNKLRPRFSSPENVCLKSAKFGTKNLLVAEEEDLSPLDLGLDVNELVNLGSDNSDSQGYIPRQTIKKFSSNMNVSAFLDESEGVRSRCESLQDSAPPKYDMRPSKSCFSRKESEKEYEMFDWCQEFDELLEDQFDIIDLEDYHIDNMKRKHGVKHSNCQIKYEVLQEYMHEKSNRIRAEHELIDFHNEKYNKMKHFQRIEQRETAKDELYDHLRDRSNTVDDSNGKIPLVRASFIAKKPMNNNQLYSLGLQSVLEFNRDNYENLIGFIDPMGVFCINNKKGFEQMEVRIITEQLRLSNNSIFEFNPIQNWKSDMNTAFNMVTDILCFEINKNKFSYRHQQNFVMKILRWNFDFENEFEAYYEQVVEKVYSIPIIKKPSIKNILSSILA